MKKDNHLTDEILLALIVREGASLPASASQHLARCTRCQNDFEDLTTLRRYLAERPAEPSAGVVDRAAALLEPRPPGRREVSAFSPARLLFDSGMALAAGGIRAPAGARQRLWEIPEAYVHVKLEGPALGSSPVLVGQVLMRPPGAEAPPDGSIWLVERGRRPRWAAIRPQGEFSLPAPARDRWTLWIEYGPLRLRLEAR